MIDCVQISRAVYISRDIRVEVQPRRYAAPYSFDLMTAIAVVAEHKAEASCQSPCKYDRVGTDFRVVRADDNRGLCSFRRQFSQIVALNEGQVHRHDHDRAGTVGR